MPGPEATGRNAVTAGLFDVLRRHPVRNAGADRKKLDLAFEKK